MIQIALPRGVKYILAMAKTDPHLEPALAEMLEHNDVGDAALEREARRTVDELIFSFCDGRPIYTPQDVTDAARILSGRGFRS